MKAFCHLFISLVIMSVVRMAGSIPAQAAVMGTAFTYQGQLTSSGTPVSGTCNFTFKLYDALSGGTQVGSTLTKTGVTLTNGLFTTTLNFGSSAFSGNARWLQIAAKCGSDAAYTTLSPRQELTPTPYAIRAGSAIFENAGGVVRNTGAHATDDFVFGSPQLADDGDTNHYARMFFDKTKAAFRAGRVDGTQWDDTNVGTFSTALGADTTARGSRSTALGANTIASGNTATAMGYSTTASGFYATALGFYTTAESYLETVIGRYNTDYTPASTTSWDANDRLFVIGNGTDSATRADALVMLKNGNTTLNGELDVMSTASDDNPAVYGEHAVTDYYGVGVQGKGGKKGVEGIVEPTGSQHYAGVYGSVNGGSGTNLGVYGNASGSGTNYGVYATASGGTTNWAGYFNGNLAYTGTLSNPSDIRLKENLRPIEDAIDKLVALRGIYFNNVGSEQRKVGVIAQEVETVLPEAVTEDAEGYKYVSYPMLTPVLIEAVKELKAENDTLKAELAQQQAALDLLVQRLAALEQAAQMPVAAVEQGNK